MFGQLRHNKLLLTNCEIREIGVTLLVRVYCWLSSRNFFRGRKSVIMQISFVMQILGEGKSPRGQTASGGAPCPLWRKARSQGIIVFEGFNESEPSTNVQTDYF